MKYASGQVIRAITARRLSRPLVELTAGSILAHRKLVGDSFREERLEGWQGCYQIRHVVTLICGLPAQKSVELFMKKEEVEDRVTVGGVIERVAIFLVQ